MGHKFWPLVDLSDSVERCYATLENTGKNVCVIASVRYLSVWIDAWYYL